MLKNKKVREMLDKTGKTTLRELTKGNIEKAYRSVSKKYHPDKHLDPEENKRADEDFKELVNARWMLEKYLEDPKKLCDRLGIYID
ncbi:hypothetical protein AGMMS49936_05770 [Endomicrobiia bacterium]|nr:hypothetical protein AGMMS49936_05770 [Endomicrobiia bacterium]